MILEKINKPNDIKALDPIEYNQLADEIRQFLIENISKNGRTIWHPIWVLLN